MFSVIKWKKVENNGADDEHFMFSVIKWKKVENNGADDEHFRGIKTGVSKSTMGTKNFSECRVATKHRISLKYRGKNDRFWGEPDSPLS